MTYGEIDEFTKQLAQLQGQATDESLPDDDFFRDPERVAKRQEIIARKRAA